MAHLTLVSRLLSLFSHGLWTDISYRNNTSLLCSTQDVLQGKEASGPEPDQPITTSKKMEKNVKELLEPNRKRIFGSEDSQIQLTNHAAIVFPLEQIGRGNQYLKTLLGRMLSVHSIISKFS